MPIERNACTEVIIGSGYVPAETGKPWAERNLPWFQVVGQCVTVVSVCIAFVVCLTMSFKDAREREESARDRFTVSLEAARKISDGVYVRPLTCAPLSISGVQRQPATNRERRQLASHAVICLDIAERRPDAAFPHELLEVAEYLYACGSLDYARQAIRRVDRPGATMSEKVDAYSIRAMIDAAEMRPALALDNIAAFDKVLSSSSDLGEGEKAILRMRLLVCRAEIEATENQDATAETKSLIRDYLDRIPDSVPGNAVKAIAYRLIEPETAVATPPEMFLPPNAEDVSAEAALELLRVLVKASQQFVKEEPNKPVEAGKPAELEQNAATEAKPLELKQNATPEAKNMAETTKENAPPPSTMTVSKPNQLQEYLSKMGSVQCRKCGTVHRMTFDHFANHDKHLCTNCGFLMSTVAFSSQISNERKRLSDAMMRLQ